MCTYFKDGYVIGFTAGFIRDLFGKAKKYYGFSYPLILTELDHAFISFGTFEDKRVQLDTGNIDHLPDDFVALFAIPRLNELVALREQYAFLEDDELMGLLAFALNFIPYLKEPLRVYDTPDDLAIQREKHALYEFLLDNPQQFSDRNPAKARMTINYGLSSSIKIDNHDNWLYDLLKRSLHQDLTLGGRFEHERYTAPPKPNNAPSFGGFVAYNTYLLLKEVTGETVKFPTDFSNFIIAFCDLCGVELTPRQQTTVGMKEHLTHANRQYRGEPIPFSKVR